MIAWLLSDGKPGHLNQSLGLLEAFARLTHITWHEIELPPKASLLERISASNQAAKHLPPPRFIISAGHRTHLPLLYLARRHHTSSVLLMKPSLPAAFFTHCLVPEHDLSGDSIPPNVIPTVGALNRLQAPPAEQKNLDLVLVGGPSKLVSWDGPAIVSQIRGLVENSNFQLTLTTSRRTPPEFLKQLTNTHIPEEKLKIVPFEETDRDWLPTHLARARTAWVTQDSVSMIYESLTAGARVGLLRPDQADDASKPNNRILRGIQNLITRETVTPYQTWAASKTHSLPPAPALLAEADRCAKHLLPLLP